MYKDKYQREKKKHEALKTQHKEQKERFQKEIKAFRSSAEEVLNELIRGWARSDLITVALSEQAKKVAYKKLSAFEFKLYVDEVVDEIGNFHGTHKQFIEFLRIEDGEAVYKLLEEQMAAKVNDFAIKLFMLERQELDD
jgi:hypothetical protein